MRNGIIIIIALALALFVSMPASAESEGEEHVVDANNDKPDMSNLPQNFSGRNGLLLTSSTHVLEAWDVEPGIGYIFESSPEPEFQSHTMAVNLALGFPRNVMAWVHVPYVMTDLEWGEEFNEILVKERTFSNKQQQDIGTIEAGWQWAFFMQDRFLPGFAAGMTFMAPTGDYTQRIGQVKYFGFKVNLAMSLEIVDMFFTDYAFAIFTDGSLVFRDLFVEDQDYEEKHGEIHAGMLFPIAPRNFLNLMIEYDGILLRGTTNEDDQNGFVMGLRFITDQLGISTGAEYLIKEADDMDPSWRSISTVSYRFW